MKAFRFTLEAVHTLRQRQEQQATELYVQALLARQQVFDKLEVIRGQILQNQREMNQLHATPCTAFALAQVHHYERALEQQQSAQLVSLAMAERRVNATFQAMLLARQQHKMVEAFRGKQLARHQRAVAHEEQKFLDDLASRRSRLVPAWNAEEPAL